MYNLRQRELYKKNKSKIININMIIKLIQIILSLKSVKKIFYVEIILLRILL
jgi:hypothetical protein